jgi:hypothetical protein
VVEIAGRLAYWMQWGRCVRCERADRPPTRCNAARITSHTRLCPALLKAGIFFLAARNESAVYHVVVVAGLS